MTRIRIVFLAVLFTYNLLSYAQSERSNELFARGVELYQEGKFSEAVSLFEECERLDKIEMDSLDERRSSCNQWIASCYYNVGNIQKAKDRSFFYYDLSPIDRRLVIHSDTLSSKIGFLISQNRLEEALTLSLQVSELEEKSLGGETWYSLNTKSGRSYILSFLHRQTEAEQVIEQVIANAQKIYGNNCRILAAYLQDAINVYKMFGNIQKLDACYQVLFGYLQKIGEQNSDFAENMLADASGSYAQIGNFERLDQVVEMQMQVIVARYGEKSIRRCNLLRSASQLNTKLGRTDVALQMATDGLHLVKEVENPHDEMYLTLLAARAIILMKMRRFKEARSDLRSCLKGAKKLNNPELTVDILAALMLLESAEGKKMDEDMLADAVRLLDTMEITEANRMSYSASTILISQSLAINGQTHEAAAIVNKSIPIYEQLNQFSSLFSACMVLMYDKQYVNARKASSKGLELLNKELQRDHAQIAVNENKGTIYNGLQIVRNLEEQEGLIKSDTTAYSLSMIKQDLLQAKLYILYHTDSLGTESFINTLYHYANTAICQTKDEVMADSILNFFSKKLLTAYGEDSPQFLQVRDIKERCLFERTSTGNLKAFELTLHEVGSERYLQLKEEYDAAYAEWKANKGKDPDEGLLKSKDYKLYEPPSLWQMSKHNLQIVADSCMIALKHMEKLISTAKFASGHHPYSYICELIKTWCVCSDSLGSQQEVVPLIRKWHYMIEEYNLWDKNQILFSLCWAWMFGVVIDYKELEKELAAGVKDEMIVLHIAVLFEVLNEASHIYLYNIRKEMCVKAIKEIDEAILQIESSDNSSDLLSEKFFILRSMYIWKNYWDYGINYKKDLLPDFQKIFHILEKHLDLQGYKEAYDAMNMLCDITTHYDEYALTVKAANLRKSIKNACIKAQQEKMTRLGFKSGWPSISPLGKSFSLYVRVSYWEDELEQLEQRIQYAYMHENENANGNAAEQYEDLIASWNDIREKQKNSFSDNKELTMRIEKLTTKVCRYLNVANVSDTIRRLAYDIVLFSKGYMLRSEQQQRKVILLSGNRTVLQKYDEYLKLLQELGNSTLTDVEIKELTSKADDIWSDLRYASKSFDDYTKSMEASWEEVRDALADDDVAIEYLRSGDKPNSYYALILRKGYEAPLVKFVGSEEWFSKNPDSLYTVGGKYDSPWPSSVMMKDKSSAYPLEHAKRIFVSPTGVLHQISIESIRDLYTDSVMSDKYQIFRVSSTRELIGSKHEKNLQKAVLYGGVNYQLSMDDWEMLAKAKRTEAPLLAMRDVPLLSRGAVESALKPLAGTAQEVRNISDVFSGQGSKAECVMGNKATEGHLKTLSGSDVNILHIATHGFYQSEEAAKDSSAITFAREKRSAEGKALSRSGLFMAGASAVFDDMPIPSNVDDGILTALEISHLDMTNVSLVVLSACETGLGDITGDGVFGLQRGFKKAGAQSILMSLWKVDDEATCLLMTEFYKHWISEKKTKHDALEKAKQTVRSHKEKGWDNPKYWAAFILLDGLD